MEGGSGIGEHPFIFIRNTVSFTRLHLGLDLQLELGSYLSSKESDKFSSALLFFFFFRSSHHPGFSYTIILQYYLVIEKEQAHICSFLYAFFAIPQMSFPFGVKKDGLSGIKTLWVLKDLVILSCFLRQSLIAQGGF